MAAFEQTPRGGGAAPGVPVSDVLPLVAAHRQ